MKTPEEALAAARRQAQARREAQAEPGPVAGRQDSEEQARQVSLGRLTVWAMIEPDELEVYSTRRFGAPVTAFKRLLIRLLRQYLVQVTAQQSRFNANVVAHLVAMDERIQALEGGASSGQAGEPSER